MLALPCKVIIGEIDSPMMIFDNTMLDSVTDDTAVSIIGDELFIDQFVPVCKYKVYLRYVYKPLDYDCYISKNGKVLCSHYNYDLRLLPSGTKVTYICEGKIVGVYYCDSVERTGDNLYQLNCVSAIGLLNRQQHKGGMYTGQSFAAVAAEIIGTGYEYSIAEDVAALPIYGHLPYSTRRQNLYSLVMAYGVTIVHDAAGMMRFQFLDNSAAQEIAKNATYLEGSVNYSDPASRLEITEHAYHYVEDVEPVELFDNSESDTVSGVTVSFEQPIYVPSLQTTGSLKILSSGVNYAIVSGTGVLTGQPYVHTTNILSRDNADATSEKVVSVEDATLVTLQNSENVLDRLAQYYFNATTIIGAIKVTDEKCGRSINLYNAFREYTNGYLTKMSTAVSSVRKGQIEVIANYVPVGLGAVYTKHVILTNPAGIWMIPAEVWKKDKPKIRIVCIGHGQKGERGQDGATGEYGSTFKSEKGGTGGEGGEGGNGGNVIFDTLDCTGITAINYAIGDETIVTAEDYMLSSADGVPLEHGYFDVMSNQLYATKGKRGIKGGDGGSGGVYDQQGKNLPATPGVDVVYNGVTYKGGSVEENTSRTTASEESVNIWHFGCGGGGGAAVGANGGDAQAFWALPGAGATPIKSDDATLIGGGGDGGHGGGGGGAGGNIENFNLTYTATIASFGHEGGTGGEGGEGGNGKPGCIIIYY